MKRGLLCLLLVGLFKIATAQPGTVPGVRMQEPPLRDSPTTYPPSTDSLPSLTPGDSAKRITPKARYLAVDVTGMFGQFRRYRIVPGETIAFRNWSEGQKYRYPLTSVSDTAFTIAFQNELYDQAQPLSFPLSDVRRVYLTKRIPFVSQAAYILPAAGVVFLIADFVNPRTLDGQGRFRFDPKSLVPAGALMLGGGLCYKLTRRSYKVNRPDQKGNARLKVLWTY